MTLLLFLQIERFNKCHMEDYESRLTAVEERTKSNSHRIEALEKERESIRNTETTVALMAAEQEHIKNDVSEIKNDVKEIKGKPAKHWESIIEKIILCVVSGIVGYILLKMGLG